MFKKFICIIASVAMLVALFIPAQAAQVNADAVANEIIARVNAERASNSLSTLKASKKMNALALVRAKELVTFFRHTRPDNRSCFSVLDDAGLAYTAAAENIAYEGSGTAAAVMNMWMNSDGHRGNILGSNYTVIGVACYYNADTQTYYYVQLFIKPQKAIGDEYTVAPFVDTKTTAKPTVKATTPTVKATLITTTTKFVVQTNVEEGVLLGDVNTDGFVNSRDSLTLQKYNAGYPVQISMVNSDIDGDRKINAKDLLLLRRYNAGIISKLQ